MDSRSGEGKQHPLKTSSLWSKLSFSYTEPVLNKSHRGIKIEAQDLFNVSSEERTDVLCCKLENEWNKEWQKHQNGHQASFLLAMIRAFWKYYFIAGIFVCIEDFARLMQPILFSWLLDYFSPTPGSSKSEAWACAIGICLCAALQTVSGPQIVQRVCTSANRWQAATSALIYRKVLRLPKSSLAEISTGHVVDLITIDAAKYDNIIFHVHSLWLGPLEAAFAFWFMYRSMGAVVIIGYLVIGIMTPILALLGKVSSTVSKKREESTDKRVQMMSELINAMRTIKMYCWEKPFGKLLAQLRREELGHIWIIRLFAACMDELDTFNFRLVSASVIVFSVLFGHGLDAAKIFSMFAMFHVINAKFLNLFTWGFRMFFEFFVSIKRIQTFLLTDEIETLQNSFTPCSSDIIVTMDNFTATWDKTQTTARALTNLNLSVQRGQLVMIVGQVGSGKSSLLNALAGELHKVTGSISVHGKTSYVTQEPWIFSDTIRENILFGNHHNPLVLDGVMDATTLKEDVASFSGGELTRVGDRGVTLSGGQKMRLSLARALYEEADIYLLDDPLSAVDASVARHIFDKCINGYLKKKTRFLVTHQLQYLSEADKIIIMDKGHVLNHGTFKQLKEMGVSFSEFILDYRTNEDAAAEKNTVNNDTLQSKRDQDMESDEEEMGSPLLGWDVFKKYFISQLTNWQLLLLFGINILTQLAYNGADWWLVIWIKDDSTDQKNFSQTKHYLGIFIGITISVYLLGLIRALIFYMFTTKLSEKHHDKMYTSIVRSPIHFFDTNPSGRILNRFSSDMSTMDWIIPDILYECSQYGLILAANILWIIYLCPVLVVFLVLLFLLLRHVRNKYVKVGNACLQFQAVARSPILSHLKSTLEGLDTIRASAKQNHCINKFDDLYNTLHGRKWTHLSLYNWFSIRMNALVTIFVTCAMVAYMFSRDFMDPVVLAMSLSYLMPVIWYLNGVGRLSTEIQLCMVGIDRVLSYSDLPPEAPLRRNNVPRSWPTHGNISMQNVNFSYGKEGPSVLKDITFNISSGEKIGIVGRTGAGKSSLVQALFRMAEPEGHIYIDGLQITALGLHDVRGSISIIPQDPVLFSGSVRRNLDPFNDYDDLKIWQALKQVQMDGEVRKLPGALDSSVSEGGCNFSVGQKQLFCLARAILKHNKILVMDEATASVDSRTDELIQEAIRSTFKSCTVLTIAHRLNTVMDNDRIMVVDNGRILEFDKPHILLQSPQSAFAALVAETGKAEQLRLRQMVNTAVK